jgi:hypothetical protein
VRQKPGTAKPTAESIVKDVRQRTRKHHSAEEKIRIVLEGLRGERRHRPADSAPAANVSFYGPNRGGVEIGRLTGKALPDSFQGS